MKAEKMDHIRKIKGKVEASEQKPLVLEGGFLTEVQQLQQSGHAKVGYKAIADHGTVISVAKPSDTTELAEDEEKVVHGENVDVKVVFPGMKTIYPFTQSHVTAVRTIIRRFNDPSDNEQGVPR